MHQGRFAEAIPLYDRWLEVHPLDADAFHNRGFALEKIGRLQEAVGNYSRAITLAPNHPSAFCNRGNALFELNRHHDAVGDYDRALLIRPDYAPAMNNKANALVAMGRYLEATDLLKRAITLDPLYAEAYNNLGYAYQKTGNHHDALTYFDRSIALDQHYAEAHNNRGHSLHKIRRFDEALTSYQKAIELRSNYAEAIWNRGLIRLLMGDMPGGWYDIEWRWSRSNYQSYPSTRDCPRWNGEPLAGKSIIVYVEQGFGDMIQFSRYLHVLIDSGADVTLAAPKTIHRLFSTLSPQLKLQNNYFEAEMTDYHTTIFSLPAILSSQLATIPNPTPYLYAEPALVEHWRKKIGSHGFRVGISWQGNPAGDVDLGRSIPLAELQPLASVPGVRLISLQFQHGLEQLESLPGDMKVEVLEGFNEGPDGFVDTAAVMSSLDLVITTDSAPAHLAGALGVPVWTLLMEVPDWRWLMDREDSPWYPTMRLFRQQRPGDWAGVIKQARFELVEQINQLEERPSK
jgi:tetratricopeptide (TPR) repeat protein